MNTEAGHGEDRWGGDGALRAALRGTAEGLGCDLPESDQDRGRIAEYVAPGRGRRVTVTRPVRSAGRSR